MINPEVERKHADCKELVEAWRAYLDLFNAAMMKDFQPTPQGEQAFMEAKARIAMLHDSFIEALKHDQNVGQNMMSIITRCISLRLVAKIPPSEAKKIEIEWHEVYLLLNETIAQIEEERARLANVNEFTFKLGRAATRLKVGMHNFVHSTAFGVTVVIVVILFIIFGVPAFGIYDYDKLRQVKSVAPYYKKFVDAKRSVLGLEGAYSTLDRFALDRYKPVATDGRNPRDKDNIEISLAARQLDFLMIDGEKGSSILSSADAMSVKSFEGKGLPSIDVYAFFFDDVVKAKKIDLAYNTMSKDSPNMAATLQDLSLFRDQNVILILRHGTPIERDSLRIALFP